MTGIKEKYASAIKVFDNCSINNAITHDMIKSCFVKRAVDVHKGSCGNLFVCAGSTGLTGAAIMACRSAQRCGCGLITLGCPQSLNTIFEISLTEAMTCPLDDSNGILTSDCCDKIISKANSSDAILFGPGIARTPDINIILERLLKSCKVPVIIDADGLYALSQNTGILKEASCPVILTPHPGEFSRLTGLTTGDILKNTKKYAIEFAVSNNVTLVLKSHHTVVASNEGEIFENVLGNPGMAKGGTGDVLAGAIASLTAQGNSILTSALGGVYIHSLAADMAKEETGEYSLIPGDIIEYIKYAVRETSYRA